MRHLARLPEALEGLDTWAAAFLRTPPGWVFAGALVLGGVVHAAGPAGLV